MSILIKNGLIYDGSGSLPYKSDILVKNERIVYIGDFQKNVLREPYGTKVIEANNKIVIPGLVSIDSDIDRNLGLFSFSAQNELLKNGVTTVIGGARGFSLAPFSQRFFDFLRKNVINFSQININWFSLNDFLSEIKNILKINFGTLIGYKNIEASSNSRLWRDKPRLWRDKLQKELKNGGAGLSLKVDNDFSLLQLNNLAQILAKTKKIFSFNIQKSLNPLSFFKKILKISKNINIQINHFKPGTITENDYLEILSLIEKVSSCSEIHFDFPFQSSEASVETEEELENLIIKKTPPSLKFLQGKKLIQFAENQKLSLKMALRKIKKISQGRIEFSRNEQINLEIFKKVIESNYSIIGQNGLEFLNFVKQSNFCPLEKAVHKITNLPAKKFKIKNRGLIKKNYFADIVLLEKNHFSEISEVLVNGAIVDVSEQGLANYGKPLIFENEN